jgi:arylsulfatase A-like enzyme
MVVEKIFILAQDRRPPNVIVVMADDHGKWASSVYGNVYVNTPHMDWLGQHGAVFDGAYAESPVCGPSRASFFTGRMPSQHGVESTASKWE